MSYAGVERIYPNECAPDQHNWNPRGDCHVCGVYRDQLVKKAIRTIEEYYWALDDDTKAKLKKLIEKGKK